MAIFDQYAAQSDSVTLSASQQIKFDIRAWCAPFTAPSTQDVIDGFVGSSLSISDASADSMTFENGVTIKGTVQEVITVGGLRAQILAACSRINGAKSIPCYNFELVNNEIDLLVQKGDGSPDLSVSAPVSLMALAIIAVVGLVIWHNVWGSK